MTRHSRNCGHWEAVYLTHRGEEQRHGARAKEALEYLKTFHPESHLVRRD